MKSESLEQTAYTETRISNRILRRNYMYARSFARSFSARLYIIEYKTCSLVVVHIIIIIYICLCCRRMNQPRTEHLSILRGSFIYGPSILSVCRLLSLSLSFTLFIHIYINWRRYTYVQYRNVTCIYISQIRNTNTYQQILLLT